MKSNATEPIKSLQSQAASLYAAAICRIEKGCSLVKPETFGLRYADDQGVQTQH